MAFYPVQGSFKDALKGKVLVIPSVSLANLPQLAVDLLIHSLGLSRYGYIGMGDTVAPMIGSSANGLVTGGLEVYTKEGVEYAFIQQRSPTLKSKKEEHVKLIYDFIQETQPRFVLLLTSLDAAYQDDQTLLTPLISILPPSPSSSSHISELLSRIPQLPTSPSTPLSRPQYPPYIPGGGLTRRVMSSLQSESSIPHGTLGAWCVEGDNREDAHGVASAVAHLLQLDNLEISEPPEWQGLFGVTSGWSGGAGDDSELYG